MQNSIQFLQNQFNSNILSNFKVIQRIGQGKYAQVFLVFDSIEKKYLAVKKIPLFGLCQYQRKQVLNQAKILSSILHPNIIKFHSCIYDYKQENAYIFMEYAVDGDLSFLIEKAKEKQQPIRQKVIWQVLCDVTQALIYLHGHGIVHRDVKPANILIQNQVFKLADMNVSKIHETKQKLITTYVGTPLYVSPQILNRQNYNQKCDIWSLGTVGYELCCLINPFNNSQNIDINKYLQSKIFMNKFPFRYSKTLYNCISKMLQKQANKRISLKEILQICKKQGTIICQITNYQKQILKTLIFPATSQRWVNIIYDQNNQRRKLQISLQNILKECQQKVDEVKQSIVQQQSKISINEHFQTQQSQEYYSDDFKNSNIGTNNNNQNQNKQNNIFKCFKNQNNKQIRLQLFHKKDNQIFDQNSKTNSQQKQINYSKKPTKFIKIHKSVLKNA